MAKITCDSGATRLNLQKLYRQLYADACIRILLTHNSKLKTHTNPPLLTISELSNYEFSTGVDMKEVAKKNNFNA